MTKTNKEQIKDVGRWSKYWDEINHLIDDNVMLGEYSTSQPRKSLFKSLFHNKDESEYGIANKVLPKIIERFIPEDETVCIALKGYEGQFLLATDRFIYIYKQGKWLTSFTQHENDEYLYKISYKDVSQIIWYTPKHTQHHIEIVSDEYPKQPMASRSAFSEGEQHPAFRDNCFSLKHRDECVKIEKLANKLNDLKDKYVNRVVVEQVNANKQKDEEKNSVTNNISSIADELLKLKQLLDAEALTQEEFNKLKQKLIEK